MGDGRVYFFKEDHSELGWLCQWYLSQFYAEDRSIIFKHTEQYMMWRKALHFSDTDIAAEILLTNSPRECKALERATANFGTKEWDKHKLRVVEEGSYYKFMHPVISTDGRSAEDVQREKDTWKNKILDTGDRELVEASQFDRVWGVGFSAEQLRRGKKGGARRDKWGQNLLGKALMSARKRIRDEGAALKVDTQEAE